MIHEYEKEYLGLGQPMASAMSETLSGAISGAAAGAIAGIPETIADGVIGALSGALNVGPPGAAEGLRRLPGRVTVSCNFPFPGACFGYWRASLARRGRPNNHKRRDTMSNENTAMEIKLFLAAVLGTLTALWGWFGWLVLVWAALMLADWLIGSAVAAKDGKWSSAKMRAGAWHKGGMIVIVCVALTADWLIGTLLHNLPVVALPFEYGVLLGPLVIVWYVIGELGSLAEHAITMGAPYPAWLPKILEAGKSAVDKVGNELTDGRDGGGHE